MGTVFLPHRSVILSYPEKKITQKISDFINKQPPRAKECYIGPFKLINGYVSYQIIPTGSKVGWAEADELECSWNNFKELLYELTPKPHFVSYGFGDEMDKFRVEEVSDQIIDYETDPKEILKGKEFYETMKPVYKLISKLYADYPEIITKWPELFEEIITKAGMKNLEFNGEIYICDQ